MAFDPDKYLAEKIPLEEAAEAAAPSSSKSFDPDKYLAEKMVASSPNSGTTTPAVVTSPSHQSMLQKATDPQTLKDLGAGVVHGATAGTDDELGGAIQAYLQAGQGSLHNLLPSMFNPSPKQTDAELAAQGFHGDLSPTLTDVYRKTQQDEQNQYKQAQARSPKATTTGEIGGGIAQAIAANALLPGGGMLMNEGKVLGKGAGNAAIELGKRAINMAPYGALYGAGDSEGKLIGANPDEQAQLAKDTLKGAATGSALGAGLSLGSEVAAPAAGKVGAFVKQRVSDAVSDSPLAQGMVQSFKSGLEGQGFTGNAATSRVMNQNQEVAANGTKSMFGAQKKLGQQIDSALSQAADKGIVVENSNSTMNHFDDLMGVTGMPKDFEQQNAVLLGKLQQNALEPDEANQLRRALKELSSDEYASNPLLSKKADDLSKSLYSDIDNSVGETFKSANKQYTGFLKAGPETLLNQGTPSDIAQTYLSDTSKGQKKTYEGLQDLISGVGKGGASTDTAKFTLDQFVKNLDQYEQQYPGLLQSLGFDKNKLINEIKKQSTISNVSSNIRGISPHTGQSKSLMDQFIGGGVMLAPNVAGRAAGKVAGAASAVASPATSVLSLGKSLGNAGDQELTQIAELLGASNPRNQTLAQALKDAVAGNDSVKRQAAISAIMQNPSARQYLFSQGAVNLTPNK